MAASAFSLKKSHDIVILSFCNIVKGQANCINYQSNHYRSKYKGKHNHSTIEPGCCGAFEIIAFIYNSVLHSLTEYVCPKFL